MKIKWGIIGTGYIANKFAEDFKHVQHGELYAVASRSQETANAFQKQFNITHAYNSFELLIQNKEIDIIYIATPHHLHFENAKMCFEYNKAILCEKPITVNLAQLNTLIKLANNKQLFFMEAMWTYFLPTIKQIQTWINDGKIGEIKSIKADLGFAPDFNPAHRLFNKTTAGGCLLDLGIYGIAFATLFIQNEMKSIQSSAHIGKSGVDEFTSIQLNFTNDITTQITASLNTELLNDAFIIGSKGFIHVPKFWMSSKAILKNDNGTEVFEDKRTSVGYNFQADEVNTLLQNHKTESVVMPLIMNQKIMSIMDEVRKQINLVYDCD